MDNLNHYLISAPVQTAGALLFLAALGLLLGASVLAFFAVFKSDTGEREDFPFLSFKIGAAALLWIILFSLAGGVALFLPRLSALQSSRPLQAVGLGFGVSLLAFLLGWLSTRFLKIRFLSALLALIAAAGALFAAAGWYLPFTLNEWLETAGKLTTSNDIFNWWLNRFEVARYGLFKLTGIAFAALLFLQANARDKEKRRKQPREYYFKGAGFVEKWLLLVVFFELLPLAWVYYGRTLAVGRPLTAIPELYWAIAILALLLLGWLLLSKVTFDGLVNRRATLIITLFFGLSLALFLGGPLRSEKAPILKLCPLSPATAKTSSIVPPGPSTTPKTAVAPTIVPAPASQPATPPAQKPQNEAARPAIDEQPAQDAVPRPLDPAKMKKSGPSPSLPAPKPGPAASK
jgi:MFS family permease